MGHITHAGAFDTHIFHACIKKTFTINGSYEPIFSKNIFIIKSNLRAIPNFQQKKERNCVVPPPYKTNSEKTITSSDDSPYTLLSWHCSP